MKIFDIFGKLRKKEGYEPEVTERSPLPEDLERFRIREGPLPPPEQAPPAPFRRQSEEMMPAIPSRSMLPEATPKGGEFDKMDMILSKLETIDTRLKLIEERMRK